MQTFLLIVYVIIFCLPGFLIINSFTEGRVLQWPFDIEVNSDTKDLIHELLKYHNTERIGSYYRGGVRTIKKHVFFSKINWKFVLDTTPEILPKLAGEEDTSLFNGKYVILCKN